MKALTQNQLRERKAEKKDSKKDGKVGKDGKGGRDGSMAGFDALTTSLKVEKVEKKTPVVSVFGTSLPKVQS